MATDQLNLAIIIGSTRKGRFGPTAATWFANEARRQTDMHVDVIDLADTQLPDTIADAVPAEVDELSPRLTAADAFVVVTPEYNHSFPAPLKTAIDWHHTEWQAKPVGFVSYGGIAGGLRAVEHLRHVFAELHATTVRDCVAFVNFWEQFDDDGRLVEQEKGAFAAKAMLDQLAWWGQALAEARAKRPYTN
ncbi:NAD(P)H-dependent FMN reductase [Tamaricihabitans halophyticus]|uniref:NAD(P)H-dependent FMN reductase n=1 Tax=Tamaricihabitans halophyticus TaxID=1262583 RepID=A0A4R2R2R0_9PSEU|nr:NAD(P)H-dependent FMN reductase [Tamaricihabitans halophyticus]